MRLKEVVEFDGTATAELTAQKYAVSGYNSPFSRGREAIMVISPSATFDGTCLVEGDNTTSGGYADIFAVTDLTAKEQTYFRNVTLGDNIRVTTTSSSTGTLRIMLFGDT